VSRNPSCKYIFLSSGASLGDIFSEPASDLSCAQFPLNNLEPQHWYGFAKAHAECRHRAYKDFAIIDLRIFAYCSHTQDMAARFLFTDIVRAIKNDEVLKVTSDQMTRDYITPPDFYNLIQCILTHEPMNLALDCFSKSPISKMDLLASLGKKYNLRYEMTSKTQVVNATGIKFEYYSTSKKAELCGYSPKFGSLDGILYQLGQIIIG
jgi:nucleoside-diphosphate-sugar epimerase